MDAKESLFELIISADRAGANTFLSELASQMGHERVMWEVLEPVLQEVGEKWHNEGVSLSQAYIVAKTTEDFMAELAQNGQDDRTQSPSKGPVVLGNIEDDSHSLGRRMVATFLEASGWKVCDLGNDVLPHEFVDKAIEIDAKVIGVSAMMYTTAQNIKQLRNEIDTRGLTDSIKLAVGGAVFVLRPELVEQVGGDGTARNAIAAPKMFDELWQSVCPREVVHE